MGGFGGGWDAAMTSVPFFDRSAEVSMPCWEGSAPPSLREGSNVGSESRVVAGSASMGLASASPSSETGGPASRIVAGASTSA